MIGVPQKEGQRGSLKWIQRAVNDHPELLNAPILAQLSPARSIDWRSPLRGYGYAEYRDGEALDLLGTSDLRSNLEKFWPAQGPQWDALGLTDRGDLLLVEAKAHIKELCSPGTAAGADSRAWIERSLGEASAALQAKGGRAAWTDLFYQLANRLAFLWFFRESGKPAWLVLANFVGDEEMDGPKTAAEWQAAYQVAYYAMGLRRDHPLSRYVIHVYPDVAGLRV